MMNIRSYMTTIIALALICLCPINAISREETARELLIINLTLAQCIADEGIITRERAYTTVWELMQEKGISKDKLLTLAKDPSLLKDVSTMIKTFGGCEKIGKDYEKGVKAYKSKEQIYNNLK